jgi:hypothetical protein
MFLETPVCSAHIRSVFCRATFFWPSLFSAGLVLPSLSPSYLPFAIILIFLFSFNSPYLHVHRSLILLFNIVLLFFLAFFWAHPDSCVPLSPLIPAPFVIPLLEPSALIQIISCS